MKTEIRCAVELREDTSRTSPGRLFGTIMKYGAPARRLRERFAKGSLEWDADGVVVNESHDRKQVIVRVVPEMRDGALVVDHPLPDTQRGRDAATGIRNGTFKGLSVEFVTKSEAMVAGIREVRSAMLVRIGFVDTPEYPDSVVSVRAARGKRRRMWH